MLVIVCRHRTTPSRKHMISQCQVEAIFPSTVRLYGVYGIRMTSVAICDALLHSSTTLHVVFMFSTVSEFEPYSPETDYITKAE